MFAELFTSLEEQPAFYYVVKGRFYRSKEANAMVAFEEKFIHINPIIAREQAFAFYKNYATILEAHQQLCTKSLLCNASLFSKNFGGSDIEKYSTFDVKYEEIDFFDKGIGIYMIIRNPILSKRKTDQIGDRFFIHGIWNFDTLDIEDFKTGLLREFSYYLYFGYDKANYEETIDFSILNFVKFDWEKPKFQSIISTPFNWTCNYYLLENNREAKSKREKQRQQEYSIIENIKFKRNDSIQNRIQKGDLINNAFLPTLNHEIIVKTIASLLNENGGSVFVGVNSNREIINLFEKIKFNDFIFETIRLFKRDFKDVVRNFTTSFHRVGQTVVVVFDVLPSPIKAIFLSENNQKIFYRRNNFGFYPYNDPEEIVNYWVERKTNLIIISDVLKRL
jgi:hypothetical protein